MTKTWEAFKQWVVRVFEPEDKQDQLTRVSFAVENPPAGKSTRWVIDFGTSATVMAQIHSLPGAPLALEFFIGEREHSSDMALNKNGDTVLAVGQAAYDHILDKPSDRYISSFKRLVDLQSRDAAAFPDAVISDLVGQFLVKAVEQELSLAADDGLGAGPGAVPPMPADPATESEDEDEAPRLPIDASSRIVVSVPNSFNASAVRLITKGVLTGLSQMAREPLTIDQIRTVRESEAIGALFLFQDSLGNAPVEGNNVAPMVWVPLEHAAAGQSSATNGSTPAPRLAATPQPRAGSVSERDSFVVLDVGGGTTDMTVFSVSRPAGGLPELSVLMNAGVPLGGTDVDVILLRSIVEKDVSAEQLAPWSMTEKVDPLRTTRASKLAGKIFDRDEAAATAARDRVLEVIKSRTLGTTVEQMHDEIATRLDWLVAFSVRGLFDMIPPSIRSRIDRILLTGRASLLRHIQREVQSQAKTLSATALTFAVPYHLKLAVGYGAALSLTHNVRVHGQNGTFGRQLSLTHVQTVLEGIEASVPVSDVMPTIFSVTLENPERNEDMYDLVEHRTVVSRTLLNEFGLERTLRLGLVSPITTLIRPAAFGKKSRELLMWHPNGTSYWTAQPVNRRDAGVKQWKQTPRIEAENVTNPLTGFPLWYPYDLR